TCFFSIFLIQSSHLLLSLLLFFSSAILPIPYFFLFFFFLMIRRPPRSTLFPTRRSSDLWGRRSISPSRLGWRTGVEALLLWLPQSTLSDGHGVHRARPVTRWRGASGR